MFKLSLKFPTAYPYEAPQVTFITPCFHPNVDQYGNICLDILKVCTPPNSRRPSVQVPSPARATCSARPSSRSWSEPCDHCTSVAQEKWSAVYNVRTILLSIQSLLGGAPSCKRVVSNPVLMASTPRCSCRPPYATVANMHSYKPCPNCILAADPNLDSPLNGHAASIWNNVPEYKKALLKHKSSHTTTTTDRRA